ncbi:hypothetical protein HMPREF0202_00932 [Cetobacterium somerae ATCC BAA-474]|uniref:Uncharacterized protein n=1 Tax=Cetobacterium somerae ATCC BAA-474 TaxID=1319815 RepID=U7VEI8_9FUSO|nr:hypothetical protein [Cetobacterium somerae]ERT69198.1 hypothetical protein HMPREF0202_00932 [Cetobacterium somerae ATCC BAA-474]
MHNIFYDESSIEKMYFEGKIREKDYKILKLKNETGIRIFNNDNKETFIDNIFSCEIAELIFKIEILIGSSITTAKKKEKMRELYYNKIVKCILLCLEKDINNMSKKEIDEIQEFIRCNNDTLEDRLLNKNRIFYFCTYLVITLLSLSLYFIFIKYRTDSLLKNYISIVENENILKSVNMGLMGGFLAINYRLTNEKSFKITYFVPYYILLAAGRAFYSIIAGIIAYYLVKINFFNILDLVSTKNSREIFMYLLATVLGYSTRYLPSIFSSVSSCISKDKNTSDRNKGRE